MTTSANPPMRGAVTARPRDRRAQIISQAAALFWRRGYDGVTVADVGAAVGVSPGAVYKHVPDKLALLSEPIREMVMAWYAAALVAVDGADSPQERLDRLAVAVVRVAIDRPEVVGLWHRESRHLSAGLRDELVAVRARTVDVWAAELLTLRPDLNPAHAEFRIRSALGLLNSVPLLNHAVSRVRVSAHFERMIAAVLLAPSSHPPLEEAEGPSSAPEVGPAGKSRRDLVLRAGAALFRLHGYHRVGIDQIGEAAGIRGPSVYGYFTSKAEVLFELLAQMADRLDVAVGDTGSEADGAARTALRDLVHRHVVLALGNRDLVAVYATELQHLPPERYRLLTSRRSRRARAWTGVVCAARPDLSERLARVSVLATVELIFAIARSQRHEDLHSLGWYTEELALAALSADVEDR